MILIYMLFGPYWVLCLIRGLFSSSFGHGVWGAFQGDKVVGDTFIHMLVGGFAALIWFSLAALIWWLVASYIESRPKKPEGDDDGI